MALESNNFCKWLHNFYQVVLAILPKSRRMITDYKLNSVLENCLKNQLVGFAWADVLGLTSEKFIYSEKAAQFDKMYHLVLSLLSKINIT